MNTPDLKPVDGHVHIVGTGAGGTGCWLDSSSAFRRLQARLLLGAIGMDPESIHGDFDRLYIEHLLARLRESSLGAAVILGQEEVAGAVVSGGGQGEDPCPQDAFDERELEGAEPFGAADAMIELCVAEMVMPSF